MEKPNKLHDLIATAIMILFCLYIMSACAVSQRTIQPEKFVYQNEDIYHVSRYQDTIILKWSDIKVLNIDSLTNQFLYLKTER